MNGGPRPSPFVVIVLLQVAAVALSQPFDYPTAKPGTLWTNAPNIPHTIDYPDGTTIKALLLRSVPPPVFVGPTFAAGFYCRSTTTTPCRSNFLFAVFIVYTNSGAGITSVNLGIPQVVWSANRDRPVGENATLQLTAAGDLLLKNADGSVEWSTRTAGKGVSQIAIGTNGNLVLSDMAGRPVWQSFDHPTDALLPGQRLPQGARLTANLSQADYLSHDLIYLDATPAGFSAYVNSNPPQRYYQFTADGQTPPASGNYMLFTNGSFAYYRAGKLTSTIPLPPLPFGANSQYLRLESDGHLRLYHWLSSDGKGWRPVEDAIQVFPPSDPCRYPTACGSYGICSAGQCSCPSDESTKRFKPTYFVPIQNRKPNLGCRPLTPLQCSASKLHRMLPLFNAAYFAYGDQELQAPAGVKTRAACSDACLRQCSCKAAFFQYGSDENSGICYFLPEVFTIIDHRPDIMHYNSTGFIKVQVA